MPSGPFALQVTRIAPANPTGGANVRPMRLPWPNGSLLPATIRSSGTPGTVTVSLPGTTLQAEWPPDMPEPSGQVWLQVMDRGMPARLRLLGQSEAARILAEQLEQALGRQARTTGRPASRDGASTAGKQDATIARAGDPSPTSHAPTAIRSDANTPLPMSGLPWTVQPGERHLLLRDEQGNARGLIVRDALDSGFRLSGRLDLPQLGPVLFRLVGEHDPAVAWSLTLFAPQAGHAPQLGQDFTHWLHEQRQRHPQLNGSMHAEWPDGDVIPGTERRA